jgi:hypothetical protein
MGADLSDLGGKAPSNQAPAPLENETRYSPARCIGCDMKELSGRPDFRHVSTSFVERQNWTVRGTMRRYTRLSNGFSRKLENHAAATALN